MTDPKIDKKVPNGVSKAVYNKVSDIAKEEGQKNKIDTKAEYHKLSEYLSGNGSDMNKAERAFIQEQLDEYEKFAAEENKKDFMDKVTDAAKDLVKRFAKGNGADDKKIDSVQEAEGLLKELGNPNNDFNSADVKYIKQVVIDSGVLPPGYLEEEKSTEKNSTPNVETKVVEKVEDSVKNEVNNDTKTDTNKEPNVIETVPNKTIPEENKGTVGAPNGESVTPADPKEPKAKPEAPVKPKSPAKPKAPSKPKAPAAPKAPEKAEEPKYDTNQKKLISEMEIYITMILNDRNIPKYRKWDIEHGKKLLRDAKALGLEDTKEYKQLKALCETEEAEKSTPYKIYSEKQKELKEAMANLLISPLGVAGSLRKAIKLLKRAKEENLEQTQEYIKLKDSVDKNNS